MIKHTAGAKITVVEWAAVTVSRRARDSSIPVLHDTRRNDTLVVSRPSGGISHGEPADRYDRKMSTSSNLSKSLRRVLLKMLSHNNFLRRTWFTWGGKGRRFFFFTDRMRGNVVAKDRMFSRAITIVRDRGNAQPPVPRRPDYIVFETGTSAVITRY